MIIVDTALQRRAAAGNPIRVGMIGAGAMARGVALQLLRYCQGFHLAGVYNRHTDSAGRLYREAGIDDVQLTDSQRQFDQAVTVGRHCIVDDPHLLCASEHIDVIVEITGAVEFGARVAMDAIENGKHVVLMNAELDSTIGPILKIYADSAGVILTNVDGDQPGVLMNLYRFVRGIGVKPVLCGNIKGLQDPYRTPATQRSFAQRWKQSAPMVTSFADGTKISFEQALVANATGMRVARRGMLGPTVTHGEHIDGSADWFDVDLLEHPTGIVDYVVGASPGPGVFVLGTHDDPTQRHLLEMYKLGTGPIYSFYTPYHLCHFEVPNTIARAVLFHDAAVTADHGPCVDVVATAKRDLRAGETLDGIGHFMCYGEADNADVVHDEQLLPMGLAEGATVLRDIPRDTSIALSDVRLPEGRLVDRLRHEQNRHFFRATEST